MIAPYAGVIGIHPQSLRTGVHDRGAVIGAESHRTDYKFSATKFGPLFWSGGEKEVWCYARLNFAPTAATEAAKQQRLLYDVYKPV